MSQTPEDLGQRIKEAHDRQGQSTPAAKGKSIPPGTGKALRAASDLGAAIFVGGVLGYWLDGWLHTRPLFLILLIFAGFVAGFLNLYRSQTGQDIKEERK